jgi:hypothetical protein
VGIGGSKFRIQSLDIFLVIFGFILHVNELLVASGGHGGMRGTEEGEWVHEKNLKNDCYHRNFVRTWRQELCIVKTAMKSFRALN